MKKHHLTIRNATKKDLNDILSLTRKVYADMPPYSSDMIRGQINNFPEGHFVAEFDNQIVGYCASFCVSEEDAFKQHTWKEITGGGYGATHDPEGVYLYGMEVCVDKEHRGLRIGQRFYNERKKLVKYLRLKGIVFGGRMPGFAKALKAKKVSSAKDYIDQVKNKKIRDSVLSFQIRNGFEPVGILEKYLPTDRESMGNATHMLWKNPEIGEEEQSKKHKPKITLNAAPTVPSVRVASVQYRQRRVKSFQEFIENCEYFIDVVADYKADFVLFPELFTLQLLSIENEPIKPAEAIEKLTEYTEQFKEEFHKMAIRYNINIIGGSHPTMTKDGDVQNICYVFLRDGEIHAQPKIHPTPNERYWWNIKGGDKLSVIDTDCGPIGVTICYDSEFPELGRHLANQGANIVFVPFCTDERQSFFRVKYCCQARAVENQCYMVLSGNVGNLPGVENMDIQYAQSCILTPCDFPFARDGIAADTTPNAEMVAIADLRIDDLVSARNNGTVQNLKDRRHDLYHVNWS